MKKSKALNCPHCQSKNIHTAQTLTDWGYATYRCRDCLKRFNARTGTPFNNIQCPTDIVMLVVLWRVRYKLSLRDLVEMFLVRGYEFTHETVREWEARFAPLLTQQLRRQRRGQAGKSWYVDETYIKVKGRWHYLYRAIDRDGHLIDTMLSTTRDLPAAKRFFNTAITAVGHKPNRVTTDKHTAYPRAIRHTLGRKVIHRTSQYLNNRIEQHHRGIKERYYPMRGFGSFASAACFCSVFDEVRHYFRVRPAINKILPLAQQRHTFLQRWMSLMSSWQAT